jgi:hypothetical protein
LVWEAPKFVSEFKTTPRLGTWSAVLKLKFSSLSGWSVIGSTFKPLLIQLEVQILDWRDSDCNRVKNHDFGSIQNIKNLIDFCLLKMIWFFPFLIHQFSIILFRFSLNIVLLVLNIQPISP